MRHHEVIHSGVSGELRRGAGAIRAFRRVTQSGYGGHANRVVHQTLHLHECASATARTPAALANRLRDPKVGCTPVSDAMGSTARKH